MILVSWQHYAGSEVADVCWIQLAATWTNDVSRVQFRLEANIEHLSQVSLGTILEITSMVSESSSEIKRGRHRKMVVSRTLRMYNVARPACHGLLTFEYYNKVDKFITQQNNASSNTVHC